MHAKGINYDTGFSPGDRGGMGWAIIDESADPRRGSTATTRGTKPSRSGLAHNLRGGGRRPGVLVHLRRAQLPHRAEPRRDLDLVSYGVVTTLEAGPPAGYHDLGWQPGLAFGAIAKLGHGLDS